MLEVNIFLRTLEDVKCFVNLAMTKDYDMDLTSGKYVVNAKSIMGVFSLDLTKPIRLIACCDCDELNCLQSEVAPFVYVEEKQE